MYAALTQRVYEVEYGQRVHDGACLLLGPCATRQHVLRAGPQGTAAELCYMSFDQQQHGAEVLTPEAVLLVAH